MRVLAVEVSSPAHQRGHPVISNLRMLRALVVSLVFFLATTSLSAQVTGGAISGTVTDVSAKVVPNVHILITNTATGVSREVTTNEVGFYSAPNLLPGTYEMKFTAEGFRTE